MLATESWEHHGSAQKVKRVAETRLSESLCTAKKPPMRNAGISLMLWDTRSESSLCSAAAPTASWAELWLASGRGTPGLGCTQTPPPTRRNVQTEDR